MTQVRTAISADDFSSNHSMRNILVCDDFSARNFSVKRWPSAIRIEFHVGTKEFISTGRTDIDSLILMQVKLPGKGSFCTLLTQNMILFGSQLFFIILFVFHRFCG